jgi:DNA-binding transcriptional ArsR family regulator
MAESAVAVHREANFFLAALAHPTRLRLVELLANQGEMTSGEVKGGIEKAVRLDPYRRWPATSQNLGVLRAYGIVKTRKHKQYVYDRLAEGRRGQAVDRIRRIARGAPAAPDEAAG